MVYRSDICEMDVRADWARMAKRSGWGLGVGLPLLACLPAAAWARTKGQGAAASSLSIEIRRFAYRSIIRTRYDLMTLPTEY
jgi:hypothetical protein